MSFLDLLNLSLDKKAEIFDDAVRYIFSKYFPNEEKEEQKDVKWLSKEVDQLYEEISGNKSISEIADIHHRSDESIVLRLKKYALDLHEQGEDMETIISSTLLSQAQIENAIGNAKEQPKAKPLPLPKPKLKSSKAVKREYTEDLSLDQEVKFSGLKEWRNRVSKDLDWPAYMVLSNSVLKSISFYQPQNEEDLLLIKGMGVEKVGRYSNAIMEIVNKKPPSRIIPPLKKVEITPFLEDCEEECLTYIPPVRFLSKNK